MEIIPAFGVGTGLTDSEIDTDRGLPVFAWVEIDSDFIA